MDIPKLIAHRGAKSLAPENTMQAYVQAVKNGINWIELDVQLSLDGEVFIFHDDDMERLTGKKGQVTDLTLKEIKTLDVGSWFDPKFAGAKIPTLDEYLAWMRKNQQVFTDIEIKKKPEADVIYETTLAREVIRKLEKYPDLFSRVLISSFSLDALKEIRNCSQDIQLAMAVFIEDWKAQRDTFVQKYVSLYLELGCIALVINDDPISQKRLNYIKKYCEQVLCYSLTEFSYERAYDLFRWGANSLFVDDVTILNDRKLPTRPRVGLLATGTELTHGDVMNTNSPDIAAKLFNSGIPVGTHIICNDTQYEIHQNLEALLAEHDVVITIGGLGPTEDDLTRNAIADVVSEPLTFNQQSWERIISRLALRYGRENISENNRQQAFFPESATVLESYFGTADGCYVKFINRHNQLKYIFMLPGPPQECMAMFNNYVLGEIKNTLQPTDLINYKWLVMGVSESSIAMELNTLLGSFNERFAYRAAYPYIEIKYYCAVKKKKHKQFIKATEHCLQPYMVSNSGLTASEELASGLLKGMVSIQLNDVVLNGALSCKVISPEVLVRINTGEKRYQLQVSISGFQKYWLNESNINDDLLLNMVLEDRLTQKKYKRKVATQVYIKNEMAIDYAVEWVCWQLNKMIKKRCISNE